MTFSFDARKARKRLPATANPANPANPNGPISGISGFSNIDYTLADLAEMDRLLGELAELEGWTPAELAEMLDERRRMAPCNVRSALAAIKSAHRLALAPWPEKPTKRARIVLCRLTVIDGGKSAKARLNLPEAA